VTKPTKKSGAIIFRESVRGLEFLLIYRAFRHDWSFPKGHIDPGEDEGMAMRREVKEETGLEIKIDKRLDDFKYVTTEGESIEVAMYLVTPIDHKQKERPEYDGDKVVWVTRQEVEKMLSYANLKYYFQSLQKIL